MVSHIAYDLQFNEEELRQINHLRRLDDNLGKIAWGFGVSVFLLLFFSQTWFDAPDWYHKLASYGCIPFGVVIGVAMNIFVDAWIERQFTGKWDMLYKQRTGLSDMDIQVREAMIALTDNIEFMGLPLEEQKRIAAEVTEQIQSKYEL